MYQKKASRVACNSCLYPLSYSEIEYVQRNKSIFLFEWECPCCRTINQHKTDENFQLHFHEYPRIAEQSQYSYHVLVLIQVSEQMLSDVLVESFLAKDYSQGRKQQLQLNRMIKQSQLLEGFKSYEGSQQRWKVGQMFSWDYFIGKRQITKFEYALWYADQIMQQNHANIFFYSNEGKKKEVYSKRREEWCQILKKNYSFFPSFSSIIGAKRKEKSIVVIGSKCPEFPISYNYEVPIWGKLFSCENDKIKQLSKKQIFKYNVSEEVLKITYSKKQIVAFLRAKSGQWEKLIPQSDWKKLKANKEHHMSLLSKSIEPQSENSVKMLKSKILKQFMAICSKEAQIEELLQTINSFNRQIDVSHHVKILIEYNSSASYHLYWSNMISQINQKKQWCIFDCQSRDKQFETRIQMENDELFK